MKRYCCRMAIVVCFVIWILFRSCGVQLFSALRISEMEKNYSEDEWITLQGVIQKKLLKKDGICLLVKEQISGELIYVSLAGGQPSEILEIGQNIQLTGMTGFFQESPNPGNFNQKQYYRKQNITMKLNKASVCVLDGNTDFLGKMQNTLFVFQCEMTQVILGYMGEEYGGILCGMLLGEDAYLSDTWKEILQKSGIGHLLAISSLHITFAGMSVYKGLRKCRFPIALSAGAASLILVGYVLMTGSSISAVRSCIMFLLRMGAYVLGREYDGLTALAVAAVVLLVRQPLFLFDAGFLLSFGAVLGIYLVAPVFKMPVSLAIPAVIFPIQLYFYYEYCIYSLFWNLLVIPTATIIMGSGFLGMGIVCAGIFPEKSAWCCFEIAKLGLQFYCKGSEWILSLPYARGIVGRPGRVWLICYYVILILGLVLPSFLDASRGTERKRRILVKLSLSSMVIGIYLLPNMKKGEVEITMLNVGQGDSFFVRGPDGGNYLIDGGSSSVKSVGRYRIEPFLKMQGIEELDYVWVSHGDEDHLNGVRELLERKMTGISVSHLVLPPEEYWDESLTELSKLAESKDTEVLTMAQGECLTENEMRVRCLWGKRGVKNEITDTNQASQVLSLEYGDFSVLFTGDLEKEAEESVAAYIEEKQKTGDLPERYDILKVGHHGSKNATGEHLLQAVRPVCAWVSAGEKNCYGHPSREVLERLAKWKVNLYNTKDGSAVKLCTDGRKYCILKP